MDEVEFINIGRQVRQNLFAAIEARLEKLVVERQSLEGIHLENYPDGRTYIIVDGNEDSSFGVTFNGAAAP